MKIAILMCLFAASSAWADAPPAAAQLETALPVCQLDPQDSTKLLVEPCQPAPPVGTRRAVPQVIGRMPATQMPPPVIQYQAVPPAPSTAPSAPRPIGVCDAGGCRDAAGARYNTGTGNQSLDANGRICHRNGAFIQCF